MFELFATRLRRLMDANEMSGAELGRRLGNVDPSLISRWRNGRDRPVPETVAKIADLFCEDRVQWLQYAGWLPAEPPPEITHDDEILSLAERFKVALRGVPRAFRPVILEAVIRMTDLVPPETVTSTADERVTESDRSVNRAESDRHGNLPQLQSLLSRVLFAS